MKTHLRTTSLSLLQRAPLPHSHLKHLIKRATHNKDFGFQYRFLTRRQRRLGIYVLTSQLRVAPHVAGVTREARNYPATILRNRGDERRINFSRFVVVHYTITTFGKLRRYWPGERGKVSCGQPLIER